MFASRTTLPPDLTRIRSTDLQRFSRSVEILDKKGFAAELEAFIQEKLASLTTRITQKKSPSKSEHLQQTLTQSAAALRAATPWTPEATSIQRGRATQLEEFDRPGNVPLVAYAKLASKSRQQVYKDINAGLLLALNVGRRGQRLPDWQLNDVKRQLTQSVIHNARGVDSWTIYGALSTPLEGLNDKSPIDAVNTNSIDTVSHAVLNTLGIH